MTSRLFCNIVITVLVATAFNFIRGTAGGATDKEAYYYHDRNMHLCPEGKWEISEDKWGKIVRVNMLKIEDPDWEDVPGVKKAWHMQGYEGVEGMAFNPRISDIKDVDGDDELDIFRLRSHHPGGRIERLRYEDGTVVWESEPLGASPEDETRLPVFDLHGNGRFSVVIATKQEDCSKLWCINANTGETEWSACFGDGSAPGEIVVGHFLDRKPQAIVVRDGGVLRCYNHKGEKVWTHDTGLRGRAAYAHEMGRHDVDGNGLDEIFPNWQKLTMGLRGDGEVLWEDRTQRNHSDFVDFGDVDGDGNIEVLYDHEGCRAARGPIYVVEGLTGKIKVKIDYRKQIGRVPDAQNIAVGNFDPSHGGLEIALAVRGGFHLFDATGALPWKRPSVPAALLSRGDWNGDGTDEILVFGPGANVDGMFSVWNGKGERLYAISFLPSPVKPKDMDVEHYKKNSARWPRMRASAAPGGHEGIRRQIDLDGNGRADVIMPYGQWHWGSHAILFLMEAPRQGE